MHRPLFSMATHTVSERIKKIVSKVDPILLEGKTEFESLMLVGRDIIFQQNEELAKASDEIRDKVEEVHDQTTITNGTVKGHTQQLAEHNDFIKQMRQASSRRTFWMVTLIPLFGIILEIIAKKAGWT